MFFLEKTKIKRQKVYGFQTENFQSILFVLLLTFYIFQVQQDFITEGVLELAQSVKCLTYNIGT